MDNRLDAHCYAETRVARGRGRLQRLSFSAKDFSTLGSAGQKALEAADREMDRLSAHVRKLDVLERQDAMAFRVSYLGWRDYQAHQRRGRRREYEQEMEE